MARSKTLSEGERKSARVSLLMTPKLFADVQTLAAIKKCSLNDLFTSVAAELVERNKAEISEVQSVISTVAPRVQTSLDFE